jgi:glycine/D-amino acid oxidase-like deaminating enzyme
MVAAGVAESGGMASDVAIIGGGIIGCSAAAYLAERGASVTLYERTAIGAGASGRNLGAIQHPFDPVLAALYRESLDRYRTLTSEADAFSLPEEPAGLLLLNSDASAVQRQVSHFSSANPELSPTLLTAEELRDAEPILADGFAACRLSTGYPVPPDSATAAFAALALRRGATLQIGLEANVWLRDGRVAGVRLSDGQEVTAGSVLVAAGPWTPELVDPSGTWRPIRPTWGVSVQLSLPLPARHVLEEDEVDSVNRPAVATERAATASASAGEPPSLFSLSSAGGVSTLGSTFLPAEPDPASVADLLLRRGQRFVPSLTGAPRLQVRMCARPQSIDGRPFIGAVLGVSGLFVCAGHGPWGISTAPASAALVVDAILGPATAAAAAIPSELAADRAGAIGA